MITHAVILHRVNTFCAYNLLCAFQSGWKSFQKQQLFPFWQFAEKIGDVSMLYLFRVLLLTSCQRLNLPHLKTYHYSWVTFNSKNQRSSKKLSLDQNTTRQWEWVRFTIPGDNTTLMGFRNCLCLTGLFGLSLVTLFMKLSLKKTKKQVKSVLCVLDNRTFKKKTSLLFILRYMHSTWQLKSQNGCYLKWRRGALIWNLMHIHMLR